MAKELTTADEAANLLGESQERRDRASRLTIDVAQETRKKADQMEKLRQEEGRAIRSLEDMRQSLDFLLHKKSTKDYQPDELPKLTAEIAEAKKLIRELLAAIDKFKTIQTERMQDQGIEGRVIDEAEVENRAWEKADAFRKAIDKAKASQVEIVSSIEGEIEALSKRMLDACGEYADTRIDLDKNSKAVNTAVHETQREISRALESIRDLAWDERKGALIDKKMFHDVLCNLRLEAILKKYGTWQNFLETLDQTKVGLWDFAEKKVLNRLASDEIEQKGLAHDKALKDKKDQTDALKAAEDTVRSFRSDRERVGTLIAAARSRLIEAYRAAGLTVSAPEGSRVRIMQGDREFRDPDLDPNVAFYHLRGIEWDRFLEAMNVSNPNGGVAAAKRKYETTKAAEDRELRLRYLAEAHSMLS